MYIKKIKTFLPDYENLEKEVFLWMLDISNKKSFESMKLEKDFLLTLILIKLWEKYPDLIFKWWTCLNKVYFPYYRLSEDLDFIINHNKWASARKTLLRKYENIFVEELKVLWLRLQSKDKGDSYKLALYVFEYTSIIDNSLGMIKIDISLKNNLELNAIPGEIQSIYIDKLLEEPFFWKHYINCIDLKESTAEKLRAALTRWKPAIRDFFDIWYIKNYSDFDFTNKKLLELIEIKLKEANYKYTLEENYDELEKQIETDLKPVLNDEFEFNLKETYDFILTFKK